MFNSKTAQRQALKTTRNALSAEYRSSASTQACEHLMASSFWPPSGPVAVYSAIRTEADPSPLEPALRALGIVLAYPKVVGSMISYRRATRDELQPVAPYSILEPPDDSEEVHPAWVVVPGLGFTRSGDRMGYGAGFYDRSLAALRAAPDRQPPWALGFCFPEQIVDELPQDSWDQPLNALLSADGLQLCVDPCRITAPPGTSAP